MLEIFKSCLPLINLTILCCFFSANSSLASECWPPLALPITEMTLRVLSAPMVSAAVSAIPNLELARNAFFHPSEDNDEDCLDDLVEDAIASMFRPAFVFDSRENAHRAQEPVVIYRVSTPLRGRTCDRVPKEVEITYVYLFHNDGGYAGSLICRDSHHGDNQIVSMRVSVNSTGRRFTLRSVTNGAFHWPQDNMEVMEGSHPLIYLSAGKHHAFFDATRDGDVSPYTEWGCSDNVNGKGQRVLPAVASRDTPHGRHNVGEPWAHPREHFVNNLGFLDFFGEDAWGTTPFCGGHHGSSCNKTSTMQSLWHGAWD